MSIDLSVRKGPARSRAGEPRPSATNCRLQTQAHAAPNSPKGPLVLDHTVPDVERLAASVVLRSSRHGPALAPRAFPPLLGEGVEEVRTSVEDRRSALRFVRLIRTMAH